MKKILSLFFILSACVTFVFGQKVRYQYDSDTVNVKNITISASIADTNYTVEQNARAFLEGPVLLDTLASFDWKNVPDFVTRASYLTYSQELGKNVVVTKGETRTEDNSYYLLILSLVIFYGGASFLSFRGMSFAYEQKNKKFYNFIFIFLLFVISFCFLFKNLMLIRSDSLFFNFSFSYLVLIFFYIFLGGFSRVSFFFFIISYFCLNLWFSYATEAYDFLAIFLISVILGSSIGFVTFSKREIPGDD